MELASGALSSRILGSAPIQSATLYCTLPLHGVTLTLPRSGDRNSVMSFNAGNYVQPLWMAYG